MTKYLKLAATLAAVPFAALVFINRWPADAQTQTAKVQTAGERFKNIKVLNDMPADQLGKVMNIFAASLGVKCGFCHNTSDYSSDEKPNKQMARQMITMTREINKVNFNSRTEVSCVTCHNGRNKPQGQINLMPQPAVDRPKQPETKPAADQIVENYIKASGGADQIAKIASRTLTVSRIEADDKTTEPETVYFKSGKYSAKTTYGERWIMDVYDGTAAYKFGRYQKFDIQPDEAEQIKREAELFLPTNLKTVYPKLEFRFVDRVNGSDAYVLEGTTMSNARERLYFDFASGLLVRRVVATPTMFGNFVYQVDYQDYKPFDGIQVATTIKYSMPNLRWTKKVTAVKQNAPVDESVFKVIAPEPRPTTKN